VTVVDDAIGWRLAAAVADADAVAGAVAGGLAVALRVALASNAREFDAAAVSLGATVLVDIILTTASTPILPPTSAAASTAMATLRGERDGRESVAGAVKGAEVIPAAVGIGASGPTSTVGRTARSPNVRSSGARRVLIPAA